MRSRPIPASQRGTDVPGLASLRAEHRAPIDPSALCQALADPSWLGRLVERPDDRAGTVRVECDLVFDLRADGRRLTFRKAALVDLALEPNARGCQAAIGWRARSFAPLFPVFAGHLVVEPGGLRLDGYYSPPGDGLGLLIDRMLLRHVARRTAGWFLERLASEVGAK